MVTTINPKGQVTISELLDDDYELSRLASVEWLECDCDVVPKRLLSVEQLLGHFTVAKAVAQVAREVRAGPHT